MGATTTLEAKARDNSGKGPARRLRAEGLIPAVVYGRHLEKPQHIAVSPDAVKVAIATPRRLNTLITLKVGGQGDRTVMLKDYQQDPVSLDLLHADFIDVRESEKVKVNVPVAYTGKSEGVAVGGILSVQRRVIEVWALPAKIPDEIAVDVTPLKIGQALHINDIKLPEGVVVKTTVNYTLAVVAVPEKEEVAPVAAVEGAAAVPGAEAGAAAPAAADAKAAEGKPGEAKAAEAKGAAPAKKDEKKK